MNFNATTYQVVGNYITGGFVNAPTTRSRALCPYPQETRFTGSTTLVNGVPMAIHRGRPLHLTTQANVRDWISRSQRYDDSTDDQ